MIYSKFYRDGFLITSNKNLSSNSKILNSDITLDTGKIHTFFGELNNYETLTILGEVKVFPIESYDTKIDYDLFQDVFGPIEITNELSVVNEVSIL
jgi:hypothetical protein